MTDYPDTPERKVFWERISQLTDTTDVWTLIKEHYPGWISCPVDGYSEDYQHLQKNWEAVCRMAKTTPKKILLVKHVAMDNSILSKLCNMLTYNGYCIRSINDFNICEKCLKAIPFLTLWQSMKDKGMNVPEVWDIRCRKCT